MGCPRSRLALSEAALGEMWEGIVWKSCRSDGWANLRARRSDSPSYLNFCEEGWLARSGIYTKASLPFPASKIKLLEPSEFLRLIGKLP
jgi:hypothetical protein